MEREYAARASQSSEVSLTPFLCMECIAYPCYCATDHCQLTTTNETTSGCIREVSNLCSVIVALTGLPIGYSVIVALMGL